MPPAPTEGSVATLRRDGSSGSSGIIHTPSDTDDEVDNGSSSASPSPSSDAESSSFHNTIETLANASRASLREHQIRPPRRSSDADGLSVANRSSIGSVLSVSAHASKMTSFFFKKILGSLLSMLRSSGTTSILLMYSLFCHLPRPSSSTNPQTHWLMGGWVAHPIVGRMDRVDWKLKPFHLRYFHFLCSCRYDYAFTRRRRHVQRCRRKASTSRFSQHDKRGKGCRN